MIYARFLRLQLRPGAEGAFSAFYRDRVIPSLAEVPGCLYAGLLSPWRGEDHRSFTLWRSAEDARAYEESGLYHALLRESEPMLSSRTAWRVRLSDESGETTAIELREIPAEGFVVESEESTRGLAGGSPRVFVRIVSIQTRPDRLQEFVALYREQVIPVLLARPGNRGAFLAEGAGDSSELLSISLWEREEDAVRYEMSGEFERLTHRLSGTFAPQRLWSFALADGGDAGAAAPGVTSYHVVQAMRRKPGEGG
ncbi:MAG: hypothetical protein H6Q03_1704 [Acidobacteria bacterium]|nr:hypothetical protein [Acidobacteriota bacterium]